MFHSIFFIIYLFIFYLFLFIFCLLTDVTFAHFGSSACWGDYILATNAGNDDGQHPVEAEGTALFGVENDYKIVYHRPNIG